MQTGDTVSVLGVLGSDGRPEPCTLGAWHPNPYATGGPRGEWDYTRPDGRKGSASSRDVAPWPSATTEETP